MQPRLIKQAHLGELVQAAYSGKNESGFDPIDEMVLVLPDGAAETTAGGITLTPEMVERMSLAAETGVIVAMGEGAFRWNASKSRPWSGYRPQPGDRVYMRRYAGQVMLGEDRKLYRLISDVEVGAIQRIPAIYEGDLVASYSEVAAALAEAGL